jgi:NAD+ synthetase
MPSSIRVALAQLNPTVGDVAGNRKRILTAAEHAAQAEADLLVTPELSLLGYPPRDLLRRDTFVDAGLTALDSLAEETPLPTIVGVADRNPTETGRAVRNVAALVQDGGIRAKGVKRLLPTYDVFDEQRYFEAGSTPTVADVAGVTVGLSVCEDAWNQYAVDGLRRYDTDPMADLATAGADLLCNISASPFHLGKAAEREALFAGHAQAAAQPVVFTNQVGANDELTFDGSSFVLGPDGDPWARAADWEEDLLITDIPVDPTAPAPTDRSLAPPPSSMAEEARRAIRTGIRDYVHKSGFDDVIVGMSGGVDSTVATVLAAEALGPDHVLGVAMPTRYTADASTEDARRTADTLGIEFEVIPVENTFGAFMDQLGPVFDGYEEDETEENVQARVRGTTLMALSNKFNALVLTPDNKSESTVGYCTLYGDMVGALAPLGDCLKGLVYDLATILDTDPDARFDGSPVPNRVVERPPSAELREDQTDQEDLPPYDVIDPIARGYIEDRLDRQELIAAGHDPETVDRVLGLLHRSEYKRWQEVPLIRVTNQAFGMGWQYPLAASYDTLNK